MSDWGVGIQCPRNHPILRWSIIQMDQQEQAKMRAGLRSNGELYRSQLSLMWEGLREQWIWQGMSGEIEAGSLLRGSLVSILHERVGGIIESVGQLTAVVVNRYHPMKTWGGGRLVMRVVTWQRDDPALPLVKTNADKNVTENANHETEYTNMDTEKNITVKSSCLACFNLRTILSRQLTRTGCFERMAVDGWINENHSR